MEAILTNPTTWVALAFFGFIGLLIRLKVPKLVTDALDERTETIRKELEEAAKLREEAQALLASYQRKQREAEKEAREIIVQAKEEAVLLKSEAEAALKLSIERRTKLAEDKIAQAEAQALNDVKDVAVEAAIGAARRLLSDQIDDNRGSALIDKSIDEVKGKFH